MTRHDSITLRPVRADDLEDVLHIQAQCYPPDLQEAGAVVLSRIAAAGATSFVAECGGRVCAYLFAYRSSAGAVAPLGARFALAPGGDTLYIHDLSVAPAAAGHGLARRMVEQLHALARRTGLAHCALVSVQDSEAFWRRLGYCEGASTEARTGNAARLALATYPPGAVYMSRNIDQPL